jgi:transportin-1
LINFYRERSILTIGAISSGCYENLLPNLNSLLDILIQELQSKNKLIRAISCWSLSRYTNHIINNSDIFFRKYFNEILKRLIDKDELVQEAAGTAFSIILSSESINLRPYLSEIIKMISINPPTKPLIYLNIIHDITLLLIRSEDRVINNFSLVEEFICCIILKLEEKIEAKEFKNVSYLLEIITMIIKANGYNITHFIPYLIDLSLVIIKTFIENNNFDIELKSDLILKTLNLISTSYNNFSFVMIEYSNKDIIKDTLIKVLEINDNYIRHFVIALIGEIIQVDTSIFIFSIKNIIGLLINTIDFDYDINDKDNFYKISVCNNICWTLGIIAITYSKTMNDYVNEIIKKLIKILICQNVNKILIILFYFYSYFYF